MIYTLFQSKTEKAIYCRLVASKLKSIVLMYGVRELTDYLYNIFLLYFGLILAKLIFKTKAKKYVSLDKVKKKAYLLFLKAVYILYMPYIIVYKAMQFTLHSAHCNHMYKLEFMYSFIILNKFYYYV